MFPYAEKIDTELTAEARKEQRAQQEKSRKAWDRYQEDNKDYSRDVSMMSLIAAVVILGLGLTLVCKLLLLLM